MLHVRVQAEPDDPTATRLDDSMWSGSSSSKKGGVDGIESSRTLRPSALADAEEMPASGDEQSVMLDSSPSRLSADSSSPNKADAGHEEDDEEEQEQLRRPRKPQARRIVDDEEMLDAAADLAPSPSPPRIAAPTRSPHFSSPQPSPPAERTSRSKVSRLRRGSEPPVEEKKYAHLDVEVSDDEPLAEESKEMQAIPAAPQQTVKQKQELLSKWAYPSGQAPNQGRRARGAMLVAAAVPGQITMPPKAEQERVASSAGSDKPNPTISKLIERKKNKRKRNDEGEEDEAYEDSAAEEEVEVEQGEEDAAEDEEEPADDDDDEDFGAPSKRRSKARPTAARTTRAGRAPTRNRRRLPSSSEESSASSSEEEENGDDSPGAAQSDSDDEAKPRRGNGRATAGRNRKAKPAAKAAAATTPGHGKSEKDAGMQDLSRFLSSKLQEPGTYAAQCQANWAKDKEQRAAAHSKKVGGRKRKARAIEEEEEDEDMRSGDEQPEEEAEDVIAKPRRSDRPRGNRQQSSTAVDSASPSPARRRSGRAVPVKNYQEPSDTAGLEVSGSQSPDAPVERKRSAKADAVEISDDEQAEGDDGEHDQSMFHSDDSLSDSAAGSRFALKGKSKKNSRVKVTKQVRRQRRKGGESEEEDMGEDSEEERRNERKWEKENGCLPSDAEEAEEQNSEEDQREENPIDKILARRQIELASGKRRELRTEFYVKYKDLAYYTSDWVDAKTIKLWKNGKGRITNYERREQREGFIPFSADHPSSARLFKHIRQNELKVYELDEREGINEMIEEEESRVNKRIHPRQKTILHVWAPPIDDAEHAEDDFGATQLFDPAYLTVDRVVGVRYLDDDGSEDEDTGKKAASTPERAKEYLVKWGGNLPYSQMTWETYNPDASAAGEYGSVPTEAVERFERFRRLPIRAELEAGERFANDRRPHLDLAKDKPLPPFPDGRELRPYQLEGHDWLSIGFCRLRNGILADEMGLGKTVQTVAFIRNLFNHRLRGPFLIVAPLSTTPHWQREFEAWAPELMVVRYEGDAASRDFCQMYEFGWKDALGDTLTQEERDRLRGLPKGTLRCNVVITSPDTFRSDIDFFRRIKWQVFVMDEAHALRNEKSKLFQAVTECDFGHKIFLTGTPIQNHLGELFTILQLVDPLRFNDREEFNAKYEDLQHTGKARDIEELHKALQPYMFRRMKADVEKTLPKREETVIEVEMTSAQKQYYRAIYEKNLDFLAGKSNDKKNVSNLQNVAMELRKTCNHPYLVKGIEDKELAEKEMLADSEAAMQHMVNLSGKLILLDKLLTKLKSQGQQVLIFSQMCRMLDLLEDYMAWRGYKYERLDGSTGGAQRQAAIDRFTKAGSDRFVFMLSTRAGGVGVNLMTASAVVIFDSDWNPQGDVQAIARAHRIGQKNVVKVYRFIIKDSYEAVLFEKANLKLGLDQAVLTTMDRDQPIKLDKKEVENLLRKGAAWMLKDDNTKSEQFCAATIDSILETNARVIQDESDAAAVGAVGARTGLSSLSHAIFSTSNAGEQPIDLNDPDFWEKIARDESVQRKKAAAAAKKQASKRAHRKMYDLSRPGGRGDATEADWEAAGLSGNSEVDEGSAASEDEKLPRGARPAREFSEKVEFESADEDEQEKYYSGAWSKRQRTRFIAALHRYGYHRIAELKAHFPNQSLTNLYELAISYILVLHSKHKSKQQNPAATLLGSIRPKLIELLRAQWTKKQQAARLDDEPNVAASAAAADPHASPSKTTSGRMPAFEHRGFSELAEDFAYDPSVTDPKFEEEALGKVRGHLTELNRLAVLWHALHPKKEGVEPAAQQQPSPFMTADEVDTNLHVRLPAELPRADDLPLTADVLKAVEPKPEPWWQVPLHDIGLIRGVFAEGYQWQFASGKHAPNVWADLKTVPGLPFGLMEFGKRKPKPRAKKAQSKASEPPPAAAAAAGDDPMDLTHDNSAATSDAAPQCTPVAVPAVAEEVASSSGPAGGAVPPAPTVVPGDHESVAESDSAPVVGWPTTRALRSRFNDVIAAFEKVHRKTLPSLADYKAKSKSAINSLLAKTTVAVSAKKEKEHEELFFGSAMSATPADLLADASAPADLKFSKAQVGKVIKALQQYGRPTGETFQLPAEYFTQISKLKSDSAAADSASSSSVEGHSLADTLQRFCLTHCGFKSTNGVGKLIDIILAKSRLVHGSKEKIAKKRGEKKEAGAGKTEETVNAILAEEITSIRAKSLLERVVILDGVKSVLRQAANLRSQLAGVTHKQLPFASYQPIEDDASLLVGLLKHGAGPAGWKAMHADPLLSMFKKLPSDAEVAKSMLDKMKSELQLPAAAASSAAPLTDVDGDDVDKGKEEDKGKEDGKKEKDKGPKYDYKNDKVLDRVKYVVSFLQRQQKPVDKPLSSSPVKQRTSVPPTPLKSLPQRTLGKEFGVEKELVSPLPPSPAGSKKKPSSKSSTPQKENKKTQPAAESSPAKKKQLTPTKKPTINLEEHHNSEPIDDFTDLESPPPPNRFQKSAQPASVAQLNKTASSPPPAKKQRSASPMCDSALGNSKVAPVVLNLDSPSDFLSDSPSPVPPPAAVARETVKSPAKKQKLDTGAAKASASAAPSVASLPAKPKTQPAKAEKPKPAAATSSSSAKKDGSSSGKKKLPLAPPSGFSSLNRFFNTVPKPATASSIAALASNPSNSPAETAPAAASPKKKSDEDDHEVIDIDSE